ncbi:MAG: TlpA family protein disulfide reductase [Clostridiales bacterium]|nr:TlpA family protein disulfide reductase [Clostridiales bacterium]
MKKILISSIVLILLFIGAYYVVSNKDFSPVPNQPNTNANNNTANDAVNKSDSYTKNQESNNIKNNSSKILAPDFTLTDLNGNIVTLSNLRGKKVFLNFWASWCEPCRNEMADIERLYQETKDTDLVILTINSTENKSTVQSYLKANNLNFTVLLDTREEAALNYLTGFIPASFFIDKDGYIVSREEGAITYAEMKANVEALD